MKAMKNLRMTGVLAEIRNERLSNTSVERYHCAN
jgi:hypothetical protein